MKLYVLLHHYENDPKLMPNAIAVFDEYLMDELGREHWEEEKAKALHSMGTGNHREIRIEIPDSVAKGAFAETVVESGDTLVQYANDGYTDE